MVTRSGFQSGAKELARKHGISLYILQPAASSKFVLTDISWANFSLDLAQHTILITVYRPVVRTAFSFSEPNANPLPSSTSTYHPRDMKLFNVEDKSMGTIRDVLALFVDELRSTGSLSAEFRKDFDEPTYLHAGRSRRKRCLAGVWAEIKVSVEPQPPIPFSARGIVEFILEDLQTGGSRRHRISIR
jgi:hypothetical protein